MVECAGKEGAQDNYEPMELNLELDEWKNKKLRWGAAKRLDAKVDSVPAEGITDLKWRTLCGQWWSYVPIEIRKTFKCYNEDPGESRRAKIAENTAASLGC